ncbi:nitroalkane oxidase [Streptomyces zhaozhouensis]|uniref:Propionate 3-nitronate monooxygenase n=1 Tax=Streptomyces zhaozhouensis TaxID=1300267 RepID=A0A286E0I1_9ACTN|nr:nitronate monooxygenase [Streptomyces zhaozhouensis]SOD64411.1 nitroalkane oxidase [Streptomyces zhaozhouensis]
MNPLLERLGVTLPVFAAPMAGGAGTPALVTAAGRAGGLGFVAAGYRTPEALAEQIGAVRDTGVPFGVNVFAPRPVPVAPAEYRRYAEVLRPEAERYGVALPEAPVEDDDGWDAKIRLLLEAPVPLVSFTFGLPEAAVVEALRPAGTLVAQSVTSAAEARAAADVGVDALVVQASAAGGHSATFTPERPVPDVPLPALVAEVRRAVALPLIATGGIAHAEGVSAALRAGAKAAMVGTVLLRTGESGASAPHRAALADPAFAGTVVTRAFTGRPARALRNHFTERYDASAPAGYPALHHLTGPLRRAATAAGDTRLIHLWSGTGHREARPEPAAETLRRLAGGA